MECEKDPSKSVLICGPIVVIIDIYSFRVYNTECHQDNFIEKINRQALLMFLMNDAITLCKTSITQLC